LDELLEDMNDNILEYSVRVGKFLVSSHVLPGYHVGCSDIEISFSY
jgi:hypothetical protein